MVGAGGQRHLDRLDRVRAAVREAGLGEPPHVHVVEAAAGRAGAALDGGQREADHLRGEPEAHDDAVGHAPGQLQRARALGGQVDRDAPGRAVHPPRARAPATALARALDGLPRGEPAQRDDRLLEPGQGGGRRADRVDRAVSRSQAQHRAAARHLVHARHRARGDHQVAGEGIGDERAQAQAPRVERGQREGHVELTEDRLRVGDAQPLEARVLRLAAEIAPAVEPLGQEHDAEPRPVARHGETP